MSKRTLLRSTMLALVVAATLLVCVVLPAEYGIDATGVGSVLGLTQMGEIKTRLAKEAAADAAADAETNTPHQSDTAHANAPRPTQP